MGMWVVVGLIGLIIFMLSQATIGMLSKKDGVRNRVSLLRQQNGTNTSHSDDASSILSLDPDLPAFAKLLQGILSIFGLNTERYRKEKAMLFYRAGYQKPQHPIYFLAYRLIFGPLVALFGIWLAYAKKHPDGSFDAMWLIVAGIFVIFGGFGAQLLIKNNTLKRETVLTNTFPDSLDLLLVCVETGLALDGALARVCRELGRTAPEITEEFNRTRRELSLLNDRQQALLNLAARTNLAPFKTLVGALLQTERMGTSLTDTLRILSDDYRMRRLMDAETRAGRLPAILTIPLIFCMLPSLFLIILGPAIINVMEVF
jgi:tight adherence protein C